jgi:hypothetical protein
MKALLSNTATCVVKGHKRYAALSSNQERLQGRKGAEMYQRIGCEGEYLSSTFSLHLNDIWNVGWREA